MNTPLSPTGNPLSKFVNLWQGNEERRAKYGFLRAMNISRGEAYRMRDWHRTKINVYLKNFYPEAGEISLEVESDEEY